MQTNLWTFQDDITTSLQVEQYIQSEYPELKQRSLNPNKQSAIINDVSIIFGKNKKLAIKIIYNGEKYVSREPLTKENIEYFCSLSNTNQFKIDEIIGSKIKFSQINENSLLIKEKNYKFFPQGINYTIGYFVLSILFNGFMNGTTGPDVLSLIIIISITY